MQRQDSDSASALALAPVPASPLTQKQQEIDDIIAKYANMCSLHDITIGSTNQLYKVIVCKVTPESSEPPAEQKTSDRIAEGGSAKYVLKEDEYIGGSSLQRTKEKIKCCKKVHQVYVGPRGGKYIKMNGKFVSIKKLGAKVDAQ
jgi:hypothetical protein